MNILVRECMTAATECLRSDHTLGDALHTMRTRNIRHLPVVENDVILGMISKRDVLAWLSPRIGTERELPYEFEALNFPVGDVMTQPAISIESDRPLTEAVTLILDKNFGALPVVDSAGRLCGIVSVTDLLRRFRDMLRPDPEFTGAS